METTPVPEAPLLYDPSFMSTGSPDGLWLCTELEDALAIQINACALPAGGGAAELKQSAAFLEAFPYVLIVGADPARRKALGDLLRETLPHLEVCETEQEGYRDCASVVELKEKYGLSAVDELGARQIQLPPWGLLEISGIQAVDLSRQPRTSSGIPALDGLLGGFYGGEVTVWTGRRKEGKSTVLGLAILAALREGKRVCVYSGELPARRYKDWLLTMAAGPQNLWCQTLDNGRQIWLPRPEIAAQIDLWWRERLFIVDNSAETIHRPEKLLGVFSYCRRRYGCSTYIVDNLMTIELPETDYFRAQGRFVGQLSAFAHRSGGHVHLVAHRKKGAGPADADEVSGSAEITNRADNVLCVSRESQLNGAFDATVRVLNNRDFGAEGEVRLKFDAASRRFYQRNPNWEAGWEAAKGCG